MALDFKLLTADDQNEHLAQALIGHERDLYDLTTSRARYEDMLLTLPAGNLQVSVADRLAEVNTRLEEINSVLASLTKQLPPQPDLDAALARLKAKSAV